MKINKEKFEEECKEICTEDWYKQEAYLHLKPPATATQAKENAKFIVKQLKASPSEKVAGVDAIVCIS